jgi:ABC-type phosphate/phosphonate transport system substrate-binding protein
MPVARPVLLALMLCLLPPLPARAGVDVADYAVAIFPMTPPADIKRRWQPLLDQLTLDTGLRFHFVFYDDNAGFEQGLGRDKAAFAFMGPAQLWKFRARYQPVLRDREAMVGVVVVRRNSPLQHLGDLRGRRLAMPEGPAFAARTLLELALREQRISPDVVQVKTQSNGFRSVVLGKVDAAAGSNYGLKLLAPELVQQIRVIFRSQDLPPPAFAASVHTNPDDVRKVKAALLQMQQRHAALLDAALLPGIVEADFERDYAPLGRLLDSEAGNAPH